MALRIAVCVKQVPDPETPASAFKVDESVNRIVPAPGIPPVVNGFDLHAVEAALRIKDAEGAEVIILAAGNDFVMDVMKKPLSMGADALVLAEDSSFENLDAVGTVKVLAAMIEKTGPFDLILGGRQASDWDQAHVPLGLAENLGLPSVTLARNVEPQDGMIRIDRAGAFSFYRIKYTRADCRYLSAIAIEVIYAQCMAAEYRPRHRNAPGLGIERYVDAVLRDRHT